MSNVVTMTGAPLLTYRDVLERVISREDVSHVVAVVCRADGFMEVVYDRQEINEVVMASATLQVVASDLTRGSIVDA